MKDCVSRERSFWEERSLQNGLFSLNGMWCNISNISTKMSKHNYISSLICNVYSHLPRLYRLHANVYIHSNWALGSGISWCSQYTHDLSRGRVIIVMISINVIFYFACTALKILGQFDFSFETPIGADVEVYWAL